jgi:hypothetical protein
MVRFQEDEERYASPDEVSDNDDVLRDDDDDDLPGLLHRGYGDDDDDDDDLPELLYRDDDDRVRLQEESFEDVEETPFGADDAASDYAGDPEGIGQNSIVVLEFLDDCRIEYTPLNSTVPRICGRRRGCQRRVPQRHTQLRRSSPSIRAAPGSYIYLPSARTGGPPEREITVVAPLRD